MATTVAIATKMTTAMGALGPTSTAVAPAIASGSPPDLFQNGRARAMKIPAKAKSRPSLVGSPMR